MVNKRLVRITMTEDQLSILSEAIHFISGLRHKDVEGMWKYMPIKLSYVVQKKRGLINFKEPTNFEKIESIKRIVQSMEAETDLSEKRYTTANEISDMNNEILDWLCRNDTDSTHHYPIAKKGKSPPLRIEEVG